MLPRPILVRNPIGIMLKCVQLSMFTNIILDLYLGEDNTPSLRYFIATLYVQKFAAATYKSLTRLIRTNDLQLFEAIGLATHMEEAAYEIEANYSSITEALPQKISDIPSIVMRYLPAWCQNLSTRLHDEFILSTNEYILRKLNERKCAGNFEMQFKDLTADQAALLLAALKANNGDNIPYNLRINYDKKNIPSQLVNEIEEALAHIRLRDTCVAVQQQHQQEESFLHDVPQEILNEIYNFALSADADQTKRQAFVNTVSNNKATLFSTKTAEYRVRMQQTPVIKENYRP